MVAEVTNEENPFLSRIQHEAIIAGNEQFRIVADRDPVVPGHLLLFTLDEVPSLADTAEGSLMAFLERECSEIFAQETFLMVEKGRSRFCSSFGHVVHAHAHLVPLKNAFNNFCFPKDRVHAPCLNDALQKLQGSNQYLLMGHVGGPFQLIANVQDSPKRLARRIIDGSQVSLDVSLSGALEAS